MFPMVVRTNVSWQRVDVAPSCLMLSGSQDSMRGASWLAADLHPGGFGIFAVNAIDVIGSRQPGSGETPASWLYDEEIVNGLL